MIFIVPAFDLSVVAPDGRLAGLVCIPWQHSKEEWMLIVGCPEMKMGEYRMPYDRALHRFSFGQTEVPAMLRSAERIINERVDKLNQPC